MPDIGETSTEKRFSIWHVSVLALHFLGAVVVARSHTSSSTAPFAETHAFANTRLSCVS